MRFLSLIIILFYILLINFSSVVYFQKKFEKTIVFSLLLPAFFLYYSQFLFKTFNVFYLFIILYILLSFMLLLMKKRSLKDSLSNYFTSGFLCFLILVVLFFIYDFNRVFSRWDEFSHWGMMLKEMLRTDRFYSEINSVLQAHKDYPPILQLYELSWLKFAGEYKESYSIFSLHILIYSMILPVFSFSKKDKKRILYFILSICSLYIVTLLFDVHNIINCIYNDYFMAMITAYLLFTIITSDNLLDLYTIFIISIMGSTLVLAKQIAITLYLMVVFLYFLCVIKKYKNNFNVQKISFLIMMLVLIPLLFYFSWNIYVKSFDFDVQFKISDISIRELYNVYQGNSEFSYQTIAMNNYINFLFDYNLTTGIIELSFVKISIIFIFILYLLLNKYLIIDNYNMKILLVTLAIGIIGYSFVMLNTYVFCFGPYEGPNLASADRYMDTFILIMFYLMIMIVFFIYDKTNDYRIPIIVFCVLLLLNKSSNLKNIAPQISLKEPDQYEIAGNYLTDNVLDNSRVFIIAQQSSGSYQYFVKYYAKPIVVNLSDYSLPSEPDVYYKNYLKTILHGYDYVFIINTDESLNVYYEDIFGNDLKNNLLMKIEKSDKDITLKRIN